MDEGGQIDFSRLNPSRIKPSDSIVFLESAGIHTGGLPFALAIADKCKKDGYLARVFGDNCFYGEALLRPVHSYVSVVAACLKAGIDIRFAINFAEMGWRKLMCAPQPLTYRVCVLPPAQPIFNYILEYGGISMRKAYQTFNMGAGFALFVAQGDEMKIVKLFQDEVEISGGWPFNVIYNAGYVEEGERRVVIKPRGIEFKGNRLAPR